MRLSVQPCGLPHAGRIRVFPVSTQVQAKAAASCFALLPGQREMLSCVEYHTNITYNSFVRNQFCTYPDEIVIGGIIMQFFENLGKKVGEAAQAAAKKSSELVEITKLNASISSEEDKIQKLYVQIGKTIFEKFEQTGTADDTVKEACVQITEHMANVKAYKEKIAELKGVKTCINCGAEMERTQLFCGKCGTKNELPQTGTTAQAAEQPAKPTCPACNAEVVEGAAFCTNCGQKL